MSKKIPRTCRGCEAFSVYNEHGGSYTYCAHKGGYDEEHMPLFVVPSEPPPPECPLRVKTFIDHVVEGAGILISFVIKPMATRIKKKVKDAILRPMKKVV